jgi:hypothetical protein
LGVVVTQKIASFGRLFLALLRDKAWEGFIKSLKTLFQRATSRNAKTDRFSPLSTATALFTRESGHCIIAA